MVSEPLDALSSVLQHRDATGHAVDDVVSVSGGPIGNAQRYLFGLAQRRDQRSRAAAVAPMLLAHFPGEQQAVEDEILLTSLNASSQAGLFSCVRKGIASTTWFACA